MKKRIHTLLYRIFSWLADCTGGLKPVVRWKLLFGTLLVSGIATSSSCTSCYDHAGSPEPMCYDPVVVDSTATDSDSGTNAQQSDGGAGKSVSPEEFAFNNK